MQDSYSELPRFGRVSTLLSETDRGLFPRKRLVSLLLRDRSVLRVICAPLGFGKTSLARQYAQEVFDDVDVMYIDGSDPSFICLLDKELSPWNYVSFIDERPALLVIDDIPLLDDMRSQVLSDCIDTLIRERCEVMVTTVPAHDCLSARQADRVLVGANDLLVTDGEYADILSGCDHPLMEGELLMQYRGIPSLVWPSSPFAVLDCVDGFFHEDLPEEFMLPALAMLLLESGRIEDLEGLGLSFPFDELLPFSRSYPQFGINILQNTFTAIPVSLTSITGQGCEMLSSFADRSELFEKIARFLLEKRRLERALELMCALCTEEVRTALLDEYAWLLLDSARPLLLRSALDSISKARLEHSVELRVVDAWAYYASGNRYAASLLLSRQSARDIQKPHLILALAVLGFLVEFEQQFQGGFEGMTGIARAPRHYAAVLETVLKPCRLQCQDLDGRRQCACANGMSSAQQCCCAQWSVLAHALLVFTGCLVSDDKHADYRTLGVLVAFLKKLSHARPSGVYRLALHVALLCSTDLAPGHALALQTLLSQAIMTPLAKGIRSFTSALLFNDAYRLGLFGEGIAVSSAAAARACVDARMIICEQLRLLGQSPALAQLGVEVADEAFDGPICGYLDLPQVSCNMQPAPNLCKDRPYTLPSAVESVEVIAERIPPMRVRMFGGFEVFIDKKALSADLWHQRNVRLLVSHLVLSKGCNVPREKIYAMFWPESDYVHARDSFYAAWKDVRDLFPDGTNKTPYFVCTSTSCSVNTELVDCDIYEFDRLSRRVLTQKLPSELLLNTYLEIDSIYKGRLLCGEYMNEDLEGVRRSYLDSYVTAMVAASGCSIRQKDASKALWFAGRAVQEDPLREDANHALMRAQLMCGQSSCAVRTYRLYKENLQKSLGTDPSNNILKLFDEIAPPFKVRPEMSLAQA